MTSDQTPMNGGHNPSTAEPAKPAKPKLGALGDRLAHLASVLTDQDRELYRLLDKHRVLTTPQIVMLVYGVDVDARRSLAELHELKVVDRFNPLAISAGRVPYHYVLGESGLAILAIEQGRDPTRIAYRREQQLAVAHNLPQLARLLTINDFFAHLAAYARDHAAELVSWEPAGWCAERWGTLIAPDAYGRWAQDDREVDFFLHTQLPPDPRHLTGWMRGYDVLAVYTQKTTPVLFWLPPEHEPHLRAALGTPLVPVATAPATAVQPAEAVWLPHPDPTGGTRQPLIRLADPRLWAPPPGAGGPDRGDARPPEPATPPDVRRLASEDQP